MKMKFAYYTFILLWAVCLMTGCSIYKPYSRPEVQTEGLYRDLEETKDTASIATLGKVYFIASKFDFMVFV